MGLIVSFFFPLQVNNENVVKVGHRQVVNMIRQGGNHLVLKVVTVTRNLDPDDTARKKGIFFSLNRFSCFFREKLLSIL